MLSIRAGTFETNSSSTHSIVMCMGDDFERFKAGELFLNECWGSTSQFLDKEFVTKEEAIDIIVNSRYYDCSKNSGSIASMDKENFEELCKEFEIYSYESYGSWFEQFSDSFTTPSGERVVAFGYYGWDG